MMDYIARELLLADILDAKVTARLAASQSALSFFAEMVETIPSADVVKVVRCKNCIRKLDEVNQCGDIYCNLHKGYFDQNAFCSYGEGSDTE